MQYRKVERLQFVRRVTLPYASAHGGAAELLEEREQFGCSHEAALELLEGGARNIFDHRVKPRGFAWISTRSSSAQARQA
jgi:hypothetical protein